MSAVLKEDEGIDLTPFEKQALDDVVEDLLLYSQYPRPNRHPFNPSRGHVQKLLDLREWVNEHIDPADLATFYIQQITDYSNEADCRRMDEAAKVEQALREELRDSQIVADKAEQLYEQSKEVW